MIIDHNYFKADVVSGLTPEIAEKSVYEYMEENLGENIVTTKRKISVEIATDMDRKYMSLGEYNCIAAVSSHTYNAEGVMFEYTQSRHRPDKFVFTEQAKRMK
jgi:GntR family trehalose operon transcriptional repressor